MQVCYEDSFLQLGLFNDVPCLYFKQTGKNRATMDKAYFSEILPRLRSCIDRELNGVVCDVSNINELDVEQTVVLIRKLKLLGVKYNIWTGKEDMLAHDKVGLMTRNLLTQGVLSLKMASEIQAFKWLGNLIEKK